MDEYSVFNNDEDSFFQPVVLKKTRAKSKGGTLTTTVQPGEAVLPNAVSRYRKRAADLYAQGDDLYNSDPDLAQMQEFAKQRGEQGEGAMLNALAAQFAGDNFAPVQEQLLKKAAASRDPMKLGGGMLTSDGKFIKDPFADRDKRAEFLLQQAKAYETLAQTAQSSQERLAAQQAQNEILNQFKAMGLQIQSMNAQTSRMNAGSGGLGQGAATQIGSGSNNEPIFRGKSGQLFTYDQGGQAVVYAGPVNPKASSAQPSEDERKAAGWFFQADNARRNMAEIVKRNPAAAYPTVTERGAGLIPGIGEDVANSLRPEDRQMFVQAAGSMAEALLRAATGAGVNESEARQKIAELVPQLGDKPGNVKQKTDAYQVYMNSLQARAGRALPQNAPGASTDNSDPFGIRKR